MSHFTEMQVDYLQKNEAQLVAALEECFGQGNVEVHEEGAGLMGYGGDNRSKLSKTNANYAPPCHIIIRRKHVGGAANDIGYCRTEDGKYAAYVSDYDKGANFNKAKQNQVTQDYTVGVTTKQMKNQGYMVKKVTDKGVVKLTVSRYI